MTILFLISISNNERWCDTIVLSRLKETVVCCVNCDLCKTRTNVVFGVGNPSSKVMFIGEAPGQTEDLTGVPFVGRAGKLLDSLLEDVGLSRNDIYITNMIKCRPPNNRDPLPQELESCIGFLRQQFKLIMPEIIVCIGRVSAMRIIHSDFKVTREHGVWFKLKGGVEAMGTFHPAALLRNSNNMPLAREDFKKLSDRLKNN